jgi:hypothetical protein
MMLATIRPDLAQRVWHNGSELAALPISFTCPADAVYCRERYRKKAQRRRRKEWA